MYDVTSDATDDANLFISWNSEIAFKISRNISEFTKNSQRHRYFYCVKKLYLNTKSSFWEWLVEGKGTIYSDGLL